MPLTLLRRGRVVTSPVTRRRYRVAERLGGGGFGEVYRAHVLRPQRPRRDVCIKATLDQAGWHREAYFAELLKDQPRVIRVEDAFPVSTVVEGRERPVFLLVQELAEHGDLAAYLAARGRGLTPRRARREVMALLKVLNLLHGGSASHGDLSPANVLVCRGGTLKLADFGVARHSLFAKPPTLTGWNSWFAPHGYRGTAVDDVFFMGQILAMLIAGDASGSFRPSEVRGLTDDEQLEAVIRRAIGPATRRYADAWEMLEALEGREQPPRTVRTLRNRRVAFAGPLSIRRADAENLVLQAGGTVAHRITRSVDVVVVGGQSHYARARGRSGRLGEVDRLNAKGAGIRKIGESEFRRLVRG